MDLLRAWWDEVCLFAVTWLVNLYPVVCVFPQLHTQSDKLYLTCIHRAEPHCALLDGCERVHWFSWYLKYKAEGLILNYHLTDVCVSADYGFELTLWDFNKHAERVSTVPFLFNKSTLSQYFFFHGEIHSLMEITKKTLLPAVMMLWGHCMRPPGRTWWRRLPASLKEIMYTMSTTRLLHISTTAAIKPGRRYGSSSWNCSLGASLLTLVGLQQ